VIVASGRRLVLTMIISLLPNQSAIIPVLVFVLLFLAIVIQVWKRPYKSNTDNALELSFTTLTLIGYFVAILEGRRSDFKNTSTMMQASACLHSLD
jgi:hypothetical protein